MAQDVSYKHYQHKVGLAILVFEKGDFKENKITRSQETLHNGKSINLQGRHSNSKCVCTKQQNLKIQEHKLRS